MVERMRVKDDLDEVLEAPGDDGVVVAGHVEGDGAAGEPEPAEEGADLLPHPDAALPQPLAHRQLQDEERQAQGGQRHRVGDQEGS